MQEKAKTLQSLGLSKKEAEVYLVLVEHGRLSIAEIVKHSGIKRSTIYEFLDDLLERNIIQKDVVGKRSIYTATKPEVLYRDFKERTKNLEKDLESLNQEYTDHSCQAQVITYSGKDQLRNMYRKFFDEFGDFHSLFPPEEFFKSFSIADYEEFDKTLTTNAFVTKDLFVDEKHLQRILEIRKKNAGKDDRKLSKVLPKDFRSKVDLLVRGDTVGFVDFANLNGLLIKDQEIANLMRSFHKYIWKDR